MPGTEQKSTPPPLEVIDVFILPQLDNVNQVDRGRWVSRCPSHAGKGQTLVITESPFLLECARGCSLYAICRAINIEPLYLFPDHRFRLWVQYDAWLDRHPEERKKHYQNCLRSGVRLDPIEKDDYKALCLKGAARG